MSRSGYSDDCDRWDLIRWRGAVASAIRGKRGQEFLKEMLYCLDSIADRRLIANELEKDGSVCAIGSVGKHRGIDMSDIDPEDRKQVARAFGISEALAAEIMFLNDEQLGWVWGETNTRTESQRWIEMRKWIVENIKA